MPLMQNQGGGAFSAVTSLSGTIDMSTFRAPAENIVFVRPNPSFTSDSTSLLTDAVARAGVGGTILLAANSRYRITSTITLLAGQQLIGLGGSSSTVGTQLQYDAATGVALVMIGEGARVAHLNITTTFYTSGVAIQMSDGVEDPLRQVIEDVYIEGFDTQIDKRSGEFYSIRHVHCNNPRTYGVRVRNLITPDGGDGVIHDCRFTTDPSIPSAAAVFHESGGGLTITATKVLFFARAYDLQVADGVSTVDLHIVACSFENQTVEAIRLGRAGTTGLFGNINIDVQCLGGGISVYDGVYNVKMMGIFMSGATGIYIHGGNNIAVLDGATFDNLSAVAVRVGNNAFNVTVGKLTCRSCAYTIYDETQTAAGPITTVRWTLDYKKAVGVSSSSTWTNVFKIAMGGYRGASIRVLIEGTVEGVGTAYTVLDVDLLRDTGNVTATVAARAVGLAVDYQFDVTTVPGSVIIGVKRNAAAGGTAFDGTISLTGMGNIFSLSELI